MIPVLSSAQLWRLTYFPHMDIGHVKTSSISFAVSTNECSIGSMDPSGIGTASWRLLLFSLLLYFHLPSDIHQKEMIWPKHVIGFKYPPDAISSFLQISILLRIAPWVSWKYWVASRSRWMRSVLSTNKMSASFPSLLEIGQRKFAPRTFLLCACNMEMMITAHPDGAATNSVELLYTVRRRYFISCIAVSMYPIAS